VSVAESDGVMAVGAQSKYPSKLKVSHSDVVVVVVRQTPLEK
jgi:hypothetical protein